MADVTRDDRGQLLLVGALSLAVLFVALALIMNTAIYTQNLATRGNDLRSDGAIEFQRAVHDGVAGSIRYVTYHNNSTVDYREPYLAYNRSFSDLGNGTAVQYAATGQATNLTNVSVTAGTRIEQDGERNFTSRNGTADWTLADGVTARNFTMVVYPDNASLANGSLGGIVGINPFQVRFTTGGSSYDVYVSRNAFAKQLYVKVGSHSPCTVPYETGSRVRIDLTDATINGTRCNPLVPIGNASGYDVSYANGDKIDGAYTLVVDETYDDVPDAPYANETTGKDPYKTRALYSATVGLTIEGPRTKYRSQITVRPGEDDS
ncbi:MAG: hypothetical protein ABEJ28_09380 [Salinigranum sp.]